MKLKNKLLFILIFFILVFIVSDSKSYAKSGDLSSFENNCTFNEGFSLSDFSSRSDYNFFENFDNYDYHYLGVHEVNNGINYYLLAYSVVPFVYNDRSNYISVNNFYSNGFGFISFYYDGSNVVIRDGATYTNSGGCLPFVEFLFSDHNINNSETNELVFQQPVAVDNQYNLQPILEKTKVGEMATKEMTQVLLVVMKKVAIVIVGLVGLLTGWLLLLKLLKRS